MKFIIKDLTIFDLFCCRKYVNNNWLYLDEEDKFRSKEELGYNDVGFRFYYKIVWMDIYYMESIQQNLIKEKANFEILSYTAFFHYLLDNNLIAWLPYSLHGQKDSIDMCISRYSILDKL
jgi:hypothetical protein